MKKKSHGLLAVIMLLIIISGIFAMPVTAEEIGAGRVVRVASGMNDVLYTDSEGSPAGMGLYYIRQLAWNKNWTIEYVDGSYNECLQRLYDGKIDIMFPVGTDEDPDGKLIYSDFIGGYQQIGLFAKEDAEIYYDDYEGFNGKKVGISIGANSDILDTFAAEHGFSYKSVSLNTVQDKIDALMSGEVDLVAFSTLNSVPGGKLVAVLDQVPFYFCTSADNTELMQEINESMSEIMVNTPDVASDMYRDVLKGSNVVSYTKAENEKIKSTEKVVFGVYGDCLPLAGINAKGECVGIYVDTLKAIAAESGLNIEIKPIADSNKLYSYMDDGTVDFVIGIQELRFSSENADNYLASNGIADYTTVAVSMPDYQFEGDETPTIALTKARNYLEEYIYGQFPSAVINYYDTRKQCLDAVQSGKADATFINTWEYNYETKNTRFQDLMEWESMRIMSVYGLGGTRQSDLELLSILEKAISQIPPEKISNIITANINMPYQTYDFADRFYQIKDELFLTLAVFAVVFICFAVYLNVKRKYIKDLEIANKTKSDFLSRMSHELRTPLNAINGYVAITKENAEKGDIAAKPLIENMDSVKKASDYLLGIIGDILDVQKMETGKVTLEKTVINPVEYMAAIVNMVKPMADEKKIDFKYTMINGGGDNYLLDGLRVQQVLFNILYNAVKFTPEGGSVTMTSDITEKDDKYATIRFIISDTGIGMSKEFMETKLFHKFAQENVDITSPYSGCGNGLAICKELVTLMGGEITCQSEQGKGTTFTVTVKTEHSPQKPKVQPTAQPAPYDLKGIRVLMCEDNKMNQEIERRLLERMNCKVDIAADGQIGLDMFSQSGFGDYAAVLMDIRMPNMDGLEAARAIRALDRPDAKTVAIMAVSANAFDEDVQKSLSAGMNAHLAKPVSGEMLYNAINKYAKL